MRTVTYECENDLGKNKIIHFMNINIKDHLDLDLIYDMEDKIKFIDPDVVWFSDLLDENSNLNDLSYYNLCCFFYEYKDDFKIFLSVSDNDLSNRLYKRLDEFGVNLIPKGLNPVVDEDVKKVRVRK